MTLDCKKIKKRAWIVIFTFLFIGIGLAESAIAGDFQLTVNTKDGKMKGYYNTDTTVAWTGVPYAKPPVGDLRWRAPQNLSRWQGTFDATQACEPCLQLEVDAHWMPTGELIGSENCLYLSIYRPKEDITSLPVYVYFHGGSNRFGSANDYDGSQLAAKTKMVVVVVQQRLGAMGWFSHAALRDGESAQDASGNYGTLDNIKALEWININIKAFGANPSKITIAGESAGAHNVMNMVISPLAAGRFHRAISQSGGMSPLTVAQGDAQADQILSLVLTQDGLTLADFNALSISEQKTYLRNLDADDLWVPLQNAIAMMTFSAFQDGTVIPGSVVDTIASGNYNKVPMILGANASEMKAFMPITAVSIPGLEHWFGLTYVLKGYTTIDKVFKNAFDAYLYDMTGYYGSRNWRAKFVDERARALKTQQDNVYAYQLNWGEPGSGSSPFDMIYGAYHSIDIPFFFGGDHDPFSYGFTSDNDTVGRKALSAAMMKYIANFASTGNPNGCALPQWEQWSNETGGSKAILFDADADQTMIDMDTEELSIAVENYRLYLEIENWAAKWPAYEAVMNYYGTTLKAAYGTVPWGFLQGFDLMQ